jgi:TolB-like protein/Flp pilus assembly protein TadD
VQALSSTDIFLFGRFRLDRRGLFRRDEGAALAPVAVGSRALDVLAVLLERPGDLLTRDEIMIAAWPGTVVQDNNLTVQISTLRRLLDQNGEQRSCIQTVAGRGYRFIAPVTRVEAGARPAPRLSIVVLPFTNLSDDREQQYFADGVTEDLTNDLSQIADSFVISRNTAFTYKDKPVNAKQIGRELGVRYALEGSVQRSGKQVRVNAQLVDAATDAHVWAERFERDIGDLFAVQNEITSGIAVALNVALIGAEAARQTANPDALDYILRGRAALSKPLSPSNFAEMISLFERALVLDPQSAEAQSYLANVLASRAMNEMTDSAAADVERAEGLVGKALAASPRSPQAHLAKGQVLRAQNRFEEAIPEFETAIALNRNWPLAIASLGWCKFLTGSIEEAIPLHEQAIRLSPRDHLIGIWYQRIGFAHLLQSRTDEAIAWLEKARNADPGHSQRHAWLASAYALKGDTERATAELAEARRLNSDDRYSTIARLKAVADFGVPTVRALFEATYLAGLRKVGMPEE